MYMRRSATMMIATTMATMATVEAARITALLYPEASEQNLGGERN
jgi:hypothetical protein